MTDDAWAETSGGLLDLIQVAAFVLDGEGRVLMWSPEAENLFGYGTARVLGEPLGPLLATPEHRAESAALFTRLRAGEPHRGLMRVRRSDGTERDVEFRSMRLHVRDATVRVLGLAADAGAALGLETDIALSASLVNQSPIGLSLFDTRLRWLRVNPALERITGLVAETLVGKRIAEVLPEVDAEGVERVMRRVLETGRPELDMLTSGRTAADPDHDHIWSVSYYRIDSPTGRTVGLAASAFDVTEREQAVADVAAARERLGVIADASARIGTTLDLETTARELAGVTVPRLADVAAVDILDSVLLGDITPPVQTGGSARFRALAVVAGDEDRAAADAADPVGGVAVYRPSRVIAQSVHQARPLMLPEVSPEALGSIARDEGAAEKLREAGVHSYLAAPLIARGDVLGTLSLCRTRNSRPFDEQDLALAVELASRAAVSVDNARLYGRERNAALTLQRSLLPRVPQDSGDIDLACRYLPAVRDIGGDWFDALPLKGDRVALAVGDVMGKGVHAAAIMGQLRSTIRALARLDVPPAELLAHLDDVATSLGDSIATCVYAVCDARRGECELSSAGHLPPVLVQPDGTSELVELDNAVPLGVGGVPFRSRRLEFAEGATLALYTDGLVEERRRPIDAGLRFLTRLLSGPRRSLEDSCDMILDALRRPPQDDVALLLARLHRARDDG